MINPIGPSPEKWEPTQTPMYKLNFDGTSKGNPDSTGYGGVICNPEGKPMGIYWGYTGQTSNNVVELRCLMEGLRMVIQNSWTSLILEGDSQIIL